MNLPNTASRITNLEETKHVLLGQVARYIKRGDAIALRAAAEMLQDVAKIENRITELRNSI